MLAFVVLNFPQSWCGKPVNQTRVRHRMDTSMDRIWCDDVWPGFFN